MMKRWELSSGQRVPLCVFILYKIHLLTEDGKEEYKWAKSRSRPETRRRERLGFDRHARLHAMRPYACGLMYMHVPRRCIVGCLECYRTISTTP